MPDEPRFGRDPNVAGEDRVRALGVRASPDGSSGGAG